ncbi:hypothetical protein EYF80_025558 [Liparis tanakae]|uniref:Secreted protein n=1 Tax=Liparis tanakae TaxID=230148 RepID=A0A4Z2HF63_9TELE|nr:hypothetical protein EYF80_025558 [Liparis tanakae]
MKMKKALIPPMTLMTLLMSGTSTATALRTPPALSKAQGKFRSPAPSADFSMMKTAPTEPSRGPADTSSGGLADEVEASRLMLSLANSSMLRPAGSSRWEQLTHTRARSRAAYIRPSARVTGQPADTPRRAHWAKVSQALRVPTDPGRTHDEG